MSPRSLGSSFRDPSGFVFEHEGVLYRQVNPSGAQAYRQLMESGLHAECVEAGLLIPHEEVDSPEPQSSPRAHCVLRPKRLPFVSYPYEWCFGQLRDAALLTLELQRRALGFGLQLKDASAYNVQFTGGRPVFIDTLSFEARVPGQPWPAYRQFCQHFLAPLALMGHGHVELQRLLLSYLDGIPLALASRLLPWRTRFSPGLLLHLHLHARAQRVHADEPDAVVRARARGISAEGMLGLLDSLETAVRRLRWEPPVTAWRDYYAAGNPYSSAAANSKADYIAALLERVRPHSVWDLGANTGRFSRLASERGIPTVAFDLDSATVEQNYRDVRARGDTQLLPLVMDLANPSPALGWHAEERLSLRERGPCDLALALALTHHLAIGNGVPLERVARMLHGVARSLAVEFIPREDPQVQRLLATRAGEFPGYTREGFEAAFERRFRVEERQPIADSGRVLYFMTALGVGREFGSAAERLREKPSEER
jgi:hypothetical protein